MGENKGVGGQYGCFIKTFLRVSKGLLGSYSLDSAGVRRADSLRKLSRRARPLPVFSKAAYAGLWTSLRSGSTYSGWRQRS